MSLQLRDYQGLSVESLREGIRAKHRKQVLCSSTGSGKTEIAVHMIEEAYHKGKRILFIVDRVVLVDQTSERLDRYGIDHGIMQAGHWRMRPHAQVQVCSAQTLEKRGIPTEVDLIFVDECHCMRKVITEYLQTTSAVVIGLTATPFTKGMGKIYSNLVNVTTMNQLIELGFLVPVKMYAAKKIDMTGAKVVAGEWSDKEIEERGIEIVGDIVSEWQDKTTQHFGGPAKTIVFSATVGHGEELCRQFQAAGFNFQQISYKDNPDETKSRIEEFKKPSSEIIGLVSCEIFTKGFDCPDVAVGISARPYRKSLSSHIQQLGRVMRPAGGKSFALWLDHSGNALRFRDDTAAIFEHGVSEIDDGKLESKTRKEPTAKEVSQCKCICGYILSASMKKCPGCGKERRRQNLVEMQAGTMMELNGVAGKPLAAYLQDRGSVWKQLCGFATGKFPNDPDAARRRALAMYRGFYNAWPRGEYEPTNYPVSAELRNKIISDAIRYAKGKAKAAKSP